MALKPSLRDVLPAELQDRALAALASRKDATTGMPWFVRVLTGFGAWLASLFLLAFLSLGVVVGKEMGAVVLGLLLTGAAAALRRTGNNVFLTQLTLSTGLAGQGLFIGGVGALTESAEAAALATFGIQAVLLFVYPDAIQRFLSALFGGLALLVLLRLTTSGVLVDVALVGLTVAAHLLFLHQGRLQSETWGALVTPAAFGLVTTLLSTLVMRSWFHDFYGEIFRHGAAELPSGVLTMGLAVVTLYSAWRVLEETGAEPGGIAGVTAFAALGLLAILTFQTPGVIAATGVLLLGFHRRSVVLLGMAVVFILVFGVGYYYDLQLTLLAKSLALLGGGLVLLGLRLFILRRFPAAEEVR
ncbi:DUF4401 domain-containing protein [Vitiosangium sp. GDMCC 1.1324]|uniref:DUF4401 domain-containing protein n=1 Tax=Vitiosangium sp. (strain GDMCC 1.1324) TaxID=2138576 RepID=UPI000D3846F9|nr:DUF4401 domain-containing protein [Vitiosangium sp. GDMCC 1.1324]PTL78433.1 DUF4401 domain-containing protein [Vitiosangium sp. GDMCC 1.1324]